MDIPRPSPGADSRPRPRWWVHALLAVPLLALAIPAALRLARDPPPARDEGAKLEEIEGLRRDGLTAFRAWSTARQGADSLATTTHHRRAVAKLSLAIQGLDELLGAYRDDEGFTRPEYEGYEAVQSEIALYLVDLHKGAR